MRNKIKGLLAALLLAATTSVAVTVVDEAPAEAACHNNIWVVKYSTYVRAYNSWGSCHNYVRAAVRCAPPGGSAGSWRSGSTAGNGQYSYVYCPSGQYAVYAGASGWT